MRNLRAMRCWLVALALGLGLCVLPRLAAADALGPDATSIEVRDDARGVFAAAYNKALPAATRKLVPPNAITPADVVIGRTVVSKGYQTENGRTWQRVKYFELGLKPKDIPLANGDTLHIAGLVKRQRTLVGMKFVDDGKGHVRPYKKGAVHRGELILPKVTLVPKNGL